jgi:hypothetical protein
MRLTQRATHAAKEQPRHVLALRAARSLGAHVGGQLLRARTRRRVSNSAGAMLRQQQAALT